MEYPPAVQPPELSPDRLSPQPLLMRNFIKQLFLLLSAYDCFACTYASVPHVCLVPVEVRRGCHRVVTSQRVVSSLVGVGN